VYKALMAVDDQARPKLATARRVLIKPNNVGVEERLCTTHADALRAILEYLGPRFKGPVTIAESSAATPGPVSGITGTRKWSRNTSR
jgi:uncharacterized protein (DUF362 family)